MENDIEPKSDLRLPTLAVLYQATWYVWHLRKQIALAILIPASASSLLTVAYYQGIIPSSPLTVWGIRLVQVVAWCLAAVACHRLIILGPLSVRLFRTTDKNIGIHPSQIGVQLRLLLDDVQYWIESKTFQPTEIALRLHHRLVYIHLFPSGNGRHARIMADALLANVLIDLSIKHDNS